MVHFLFAAGVVGGVQDGFPLGGGHGGVGVEGVGGHGQGHAEADGDVVEVHGFSPDLNF